VIVGISGAHLFVFSMWYSRILVAKWLRQLYCCRDTRPTVAEPGCKLFVTGNLPILVKQFQLSILAVYCQWVNGQTLLLCTPYLVQASFLHLDR